MLCPEAAIASIQPWVAVTGTGTVIQPEAVRRAMTGLVAPFSPPIQSRVLVPARNPPPTGSALGGCGVVANRNPAGAPTCRQPRPFQCSTVVAPRS